MDTELENQELYIIICQLLKDLFNRGKQNKSNKNYEIAGTNILDSLSQT